MDASPLPSPEQLKEALGPAHGAFRLRWWLLGGTVLAAAVLAGVFFTLKARRARVVYESGTVTRGDLQLLVSATGTLQAVISVEVGAEVSGRLQKVLVDVNAVVKKGQILAEVDPEPYRSAVEQARAQLLGAKAAIALAAATALESSQTLARNQSLGKAGILSQADLDAAQGTRKRSDAALHSAQEEAGAAQTVLDLATSKLLKTTIRAPINGVVLARLVEQGQTVTAAFQTPVLFKLAQDLRMMRLNVDIDEADVSHIHSGQSATFTVEAFPGRTFPSQVTSLQMEPKVTLNVVTYQAVLTADNPAMELLPGMTCTAMIAAGTRSQVLLVPNAALRYTPAAPKAVKGGVTLPEGTHRVWVLTAGVPAPVDVKLGSSDGHLTEVLPGPLLEGMHVITGTRSGP
jgi:HlyD family secretion protein